MAVAKEIIEQLDHLVNELAVAHKCYVRAVKDYKEVQNGLWLNTDFAEVLGKSRPTVDEKKAYISAHSLTHRTVKEEAYYKILDIRHRIEVCKLKLEYLTDE